MYRFVRRIHSNICLYNHLIFIINHGNENGSTRYIKPADCNEKKFFVCSTQPSTGENDDLCPMHHYNYKSHCLKPSPRTMTYDNAIVSSFHYFRHIHLNSNLNIIQPRPKHYILTKLNLLGCLR